MTDVVTSLKIGFGNSALNARLHAAAGYEEELRRLVLRFRTGAQTSQRVGEVAIDDLLVNLSELASWADTTGVVWDPDLAALATDTARDSQKVDAWLTDGSEAETLGEQDVRARLGAEWVADLTSFQQRDLAKLLSLGHGANFSVPGAGKTRVGLAAFQALRRGGEIDRLLIVGPKSCYEAWLEENNHCFTRPLRMEIYQGHPDQAADAIVVNYERLDRATNALARWLSARPSMVILDEAHRMKLGADGTYGSACLALGPRARRRLILTGTPAPNGAKDLENLLSFVWPGYGRQTVTRAVAGGDLAHASSVLKPLFTRTTKRELGLPPVTTSLRTVPLPALHREVYNALLGQFAGRAARSPGDLQAMGKISVYLLMAATSPALLAVGSTRYEPLSYRVPPLSVPSGAPLDDLLRDLPNYEMSPKYQEALAQVASNAAAGRKTLIWSTFVRSLKTLAHMLQAFSPALVYGGTEDRSGEIARFRSDPDCMVLLSNPATLGEGISLHHECHDALYIDRDFAAGKFLQSLDRIHRLGLAPGTETRITVLASEGTIDDLVTERLEQKLEFMGRILDDSAVQELADLEDESPVGGGLDVRDIQSLMGHLRGHSS